jgi:DNA-binding IclR family transcriptional regulator
MPRDSSEVPSQSLVRAMDILDQFTHGRTELDLNELTRRTGLSKATVHRYCISLRNLDWLRYDSHTAKYSLGTRPIELGAIALQGHPLVRVADRLLRDLMDDVERTLVLAVWDGNAPLIVRANDNSRSVIQVGVRVGSRLDPFESAHGPVYLAFSERIHNQFENTKALEEIEPRLEQIRRAGVSVRRASRGIMVAAVPIGADVSGTLAVLSSESAIDAPIIERLKDSAKILAAELDGRPTGLSG